MAASDPAHASRNAAIAAYTRWSREDPGPNAQRGQAGLIAKFEREAREADPLASDREIARRGMAGYRAHMIRIANASAKARKARAGAA
jgi:hypothetical protein